MNWVQGWQTTVKPMGTVAHTLLNTLAIGGMLGHSWILPASAQMSGAASREAPLQAPPQPSDPSSNAIVAQASTPPRQFLPYCQQTLDEINRKESVRQKAFQGDRAAKQQYQALIQADADQLQRCRQQNRLHQEGIWLRLYPCDAQPGALEAVLDRIVDRGYNQVFVETFYNGQVLLPAANNPTAWPSMLITPGQERTDLLAEIIQKGKARGLKVSAWMFSLNVGYTYAMRPEKRETIALNGRGQTTIETNLASKELNKTFNPNEAFADPYNPVLRQDYLKMVQEVVKRRPDGIVFDYIRYPKGQGAASVVSEVKDLWIYGESSQAALLQRALNSKGRDLIARYVRQGYITTQDIETVDRSYPQETDPPLWQGRTPSPDENQLPLAQRQELLQAELWRLVMGHAMQGIVDYLTAAATMVQRSGIAVGSVFFPEGNQAVGQGADSRLQPWDRFPEWIDRYPMSYGVCGGVDCIVDQVRRVLSQTSHSRIVKPVIAGIWQQPISNRPALELQMQAIEQVFPQVDSISHFAYSWQEPESDQDRKACRVPRF